MAVPSRQLFIVGQWAPPARGGELEVFNPSTGGVIGRIPAGTAEDVNRAVQEATLAFAGAWSKTTGKQRAEVLKRIAEMVRKNKEQMARWECLDCGKPIVECEADMDDVAGTFEYYAGLAEQLDRQQGQLVDCGTPDYQVSVLRQPLGVVGLITPWNYPLLMAAWKVAPALAAGCCCVLKPSELASITCLELADLAAQAGLPPGVLNVVTGTGADAGAPLAAHPGLAKVAFTGSVATGRRVALAAAANLRPTTMELGGKSPLLVFPDCEVAQAVEWAMYGCFSQNGQICSATSRLLLHASIAPRFLQLLKARAESIAVGDPLSPATRLGPLVSQGQLAKVQGYIRSGLEEGATLLTGGGRPAGEGCPSGGYFVQPTVFTHVTPGMRIWREEIFGPVLAVMTFTSEQEALQLANDTEYGLGGAVISADAERCRRVTAALQCGIVWQGCSQPCFSQAPWGGIKNSGYGRELGTVGLENFLNIKQVIANVSRQPWTWYSPPAAAPDGPAAPGLTTSDKERHWLQQAVEENRRTGGGMGR